MSAIEIASLLTKANELKEFDFSSADSVLSNAIVLARTLFGAESPHVVELGNVFFKPIDLVYNSGHYMNRVYWNEGIERLRRVLKAMVYELKVAETQASVSLYPPEKITLKWMFHHVSIRWWLFIAGLLVSAVSLGFSLCKLMQ